MSKINDILITAAENLLYGWPKMSLDDAIHYIMCESDEALKYWVGYQPFQTRDPRIIDVYKISGIGLINMTNLLPEEQTSILIKKCPEKDVFYLYIFQNDGKK